MYIRQQQKRNFANKTVASAYPREKARYRKNGSWRARECVGHDIVIDILQ